MTDWANQILQETPQPAQSPSAPVPQSAPQQKDWAAAVTALPERPTVNPTYDDTKGATAGQVAVGSMASNNGELIRYYASKLYPNEPLEMAAQRFDLAPDGSVYHVADDGKAYLAEPDGFDIESPLRSLANGIGPTIPAASGVLTGIATAPLMMTGLGTAGAVAATGAAGYGGDVARQKLGDVLMGPEVTNGKINQFPAIQAAAFEGFGQGIGKGMGVLSERFAVNDLARYSPQKTTESLERANRWGVPLTPAESTGLSSLAAEQKRIGNLPLTQDTVQEFYQARNNQIFDAWQGFLDTVSKNGDIDDVTAMASDAAQSAIKRAEEARAAVASPIYQRVVQPDNLIEGFEPDSLLAGIIKGLRRDPVYKMQVQDLPDNSMVVLDAAYKKLGDMARGASIGGQKNRARLIDETRRGLVDQMDTAFPEYGAARAAFAEGSGPLDSLLSSTVKILADVTDGRTKMAIVDVLNPNKRTPQSIANLRMTLQGENPEAWQAIKRVFLQSEMTNAWKISQTGGVINPAGKLYQRFSQPDMRAVMKAALSDEEWRSVTDLLTVMRDASKVKPIGSDTEWNRLMTQAAEDQAKGIGGKVAEFDVTKPFSLVNDFLVQRRVDKNAMRMAELIVSGDKEVISKLRELRMLAPSGWRWRAAFGQLLGIAGQSAVPANALDNSGTGNKPQPNQ